MKRLKYLAAAAAITLGAAPIQAHADWYAGVGYTQFQFDGADVDAGTARLGYKFNPNFAVEAEGSTGFDDEDGVELNHNLGAYGVAMVPITENFDVHGRLGYQTTEVDTPFGDADDDGVAYGAGVTWRPMGGFGIRADYTRLEGEDSTDAISLGGVVNF